MLATLQRFARGRQLRPPLLDAAQRRRLGIAFGAAALVVVAYTLWRRWTTMPEGKGWLDAYVYIESASTLLHNPAHLYDGARVQAATLIAQRAYLYPPAGLLPFLPLALIRDTMGIAAAARMWVLIDAACLIAAVLMMCRQLDLGVLTTGAALLLVAVVGTTQIEIGSGQVNSVVLLLVALAWRDLPGARGGVWLGLAMALKPVAPLLLLVPLLRRQYRAAIVAAGVAVGLNVLIVPLIGLDGAWFYVTRLGPFLASHWEIVDINNISPSNLIKVAVGGEPPYPGNHWPLTPIHLAGVASAAALILRLGSLLLALRGIRRASTTGLALTAALAAVLLCSGTVWAHYYTFLVPLLLVGLTQLSPARRAALFAAVALLAVYPQLGWLWLPDVERSPDLGSWFFFGRGVLFVLVTCVVTVWALVRIGGTGRGRAGVGGTSATVAA